MACFEHHTKSLLVAAYQPICLHDFMVSTRLHIIDLWEAWIFFGLKVLNMCKYEIDCLAYLLLQEGVFSRNRSFRNKLKKAGMRQECPLKFIAVTLLSKHHIFFTSFKYTLCTVFLVLVHCFLFYGNPRVLIWWLAGLKMFSVLQRWWLDDFEGIYALTWQYLESPRYEMCFFCSQWWD